MADKQIGALTVGTKPTGAELLHVVQGGNSRQLTLAEVADIGLNIITDATTARTLVVTDHGSYIRFTNVSAITLTVDTGVFSAGDEITFEQVGAGVVTVTAGAGVTINSRGARIATNGEFSVASLKCITTGEFTLFGDLV